jgi:uncharacterized protein YbjQ (UPF0145 family)
MYDYMEVEKMIVTNTDYIPGKNITQILGIVKGSCVKARWIGKDIRAIGRAIIGGEMKYYSELLDAARNVATNRMVEEATRLGADAVINVRYHTAMVVQGSSEVLVYGTAVKLE